MKYFSVDLNAVQRHELTGLSRQTINKYLVAIRLRIVDYCQREFAPLKGQIEVDESHEGARRVKGRRGRGARGKTIVFGLLKRENEGLLITPCSSAHAFGMRYAIDLVFLDEHLTIVKTVESLRPWRMSAASAANMVLELATNSIQQLQLATGQQLEWHNDSQN